MAERNDMRGVLVPLVAAGAALWLMGRKRPPSVDDINVEDAGTPTLSPNQLILMADALEAALIGGWLGEDEDSIFAVMQLPQNDADVYALISTFGTRCEGQLIQRCGSLPQWFTIYLSTDEIAAINDSMAVKGITVRF